MATTKRKRIPIKPTPKEEIQLRKEIQADLMLLCEKHAKANDLRLTYTISSVAHQCRLLELGNAFDEGARSVECRGYPVGFQRNGKLEKRKGR